MTLNGHFALKSVSGSATKELEFLAFRQNCSKISRAIPIYCQRKNCSPGILVSSKVSFMRIFAGVRWSGVLLVNGENRNLLLSLAISSEPSHLRLHLLYCGHFALKSGSASASNGLVFWLSEKTVRKFAELHIYCERQKCSPARHCRPTGDSL